MMSEIVNKGDKIAFISKNSNALTNFFEILNNKMKGDNGEIAVGTTIKSAYLPNDNSAYFNSNREALSIGYENLQKLRKRERMYI